MFAKCYKNGTQVKSYSYIVDVKYVKKYDFFEFHEKIYHHEIIFVHGPVEVDRVEIYEHGFDKKPIRTVERTHNEKED